MSYTRQELEEFVVEFEKYDSMRSFSLLTGMPRTSARRRHAQAIRLGLIAPFKHRVPEGMEIRTVTDIYRDNKIVLESIKMAPASQTFAGVPEGYKIKGVSTLIDASGNKILEWVKTGQEVSLDRTIEIVQKAFQNYVAPTARLKLPTLNDEDRLTLYPVLDWHMGLLALKKQTLDTEWNLEIAVRTIKQGIRELVEMSPNSATALVMCLGDLLHSDNSENRTRKHGNKLDVDGLYEDILLATCDLLIFFLDLLAEKHLNIEVDLKRGNHDEDSTAAIRLALMMRYRDHPGIKINGCGGFFYFKQFGVVLLGGTHGDQQKASKLPMIMANSMKQAWAETTTRLFFVGHIHHEISGMEDGGVRVISLRAPVPKDAWHAGVGFVSGRSLYAFHFHRLLGSRGRSEVEFLL